MKILLAEDEIDLQRALVTMLSYSDYEVDAVDNGNQAVEKASENVYDCMIFDIMMPELDGISALKILREKGNVSPAIFLTAKSEIDDRINGLDAGADDYLTKPFAMGELLARIRSMTRRNISYSPKILSFGKVSLNTEDQELISENSIRLSGREEKLMEFLMKNSGKKLTDSDILCHVWDDENEKNPEVVWVYISYLNNKLKSIDADIHIDGAKGEDYILKTI